MNLKLLLLSKKDVQLRFEFNDFLKKRRRSIFGTMTEELRESFCRVKLRNRLIILTHQFKNHLIRPFS